MQRRKSAKSATKKQNQHDVGAYIESNGEKINAIKIDGGAQGPSEIRKPASSDKPMMSAQPAVGIK